jgi:hypothetical protein
MVTPIEFEFYPNPIKDYLAIFVSPSENNNLRATIYNEIGQAVYQQNHIQPAVPYTFNLERLTNGLYYLILEGNSKSAMRKIVVYK